MKYVPHPKQDRDGRGRPYLLGSAIFCRDCGVTLVMTDRGWVVTAHSASLIGLSKEEAMDCDVCRRIDVVTSVMDS